MTNSVVDDFEFISKRLKEIAAEKSKDSTPEKDYVESPTLREIPDPPSSDELDDMVLSSYADMCGYQDFQITYKQATDIYAMWLKMHPEVARIWDNLEDPYDKDYIRSIASVDWQCYHDFSFEEDNN